MRFALSFLVPAVLLAGCAGAQAEIASSMPVTVATVLEAGLPQGLTLTGTFTPAEEVDLSAKTGGKLVFLAVDAGSRVHAGDLIARVDTDTDIARIKSVSGQTGEIDASLTALRALYDERRSATLREMERTRTTFDSQITIQKTRIAEAEGSGRTRASDAGQSAIDLATKQLTSTQETLRISGKSAQESARTLMGTAQDALDSILGVTPRYEKNNDSFESALGNLDASAKTQAEAAFRVFLEVRQGDTADLPQTLLALDAGKTALDATYTLLLKTEPVATFPIGTLEADKTNMRALMAQIEQVLQDMRLLMQGTQGTTSTAVLQEQIDAAEVQKKTALAAVESEITVLKKQLDDLQAQKDAEIKRLQDPLTLITREQDAKERELLTQKTMLRGEQEVIGTALASGSVYAPFNGVVTDKLQEVGSIVAGGQTLIRLADSRAMKLTLSIPDAAVLSFGVGKKASLTVDSISERTFVGIITKVLPEADTGSKKIRIEITVDNADGALKAGMFARSAFALSEEKGLIIPSDAVISRYGKTYVFVVANGIAVEQEIVLGRTEGAVTLVASGLTIGEEVVTEGHRFLRSGTSVMLSK